MEVSAQGAFCAVRKCLTINAAEGVVEGFGKSILECASTSCLFIVEGNQEWQNLI